MAHRAAPHSEYARLLAENDRYSESFDRSELGARALSGLAIVACMDSRLDVEEALGLRNGDAHIIRNAGGLVTDDVIRSLIISQRVLGTDEIVVIGHTGCGLHGADETALQATLAGDVDGDEASAIAFGAFDDLEANIRAQVARLQAAPSIRQVPIHGLIYDVSTGRLTELV